MLLPLLLAGKDRPSEFALNQKGDLVRILSDIDLDRKLDTNIAIEVLVQTFLSRFEADVRELIS